MQNTLAHARRPADRGIPAWLLAGLFWLFTYSLFAYGAQLRYGDAFELFTAQRVVATLIGAGLYWLALRSLIRVGEAKPANPIAVIGTILPASIVVLASRLILDGFLAEPSGIETNLRFMMVWAGYFGLWVSGSLALHMHSGTSHAAQSAATQPAAPMMLGASRRTVEERGRTIDEMVAEIATMAPRERAMLLDRLIFGASYELADPLDRHVSPVISTAPGR